MARPEMGIPNWIWLWTGRADIRQQGLHILFHVSRHQLSFAVDSVSTSPLLGAKQIYVRYEKALGPVGVVQHSTTVGDRQTEPLGALWLW
jgi:hypothetical protein